jgi:hypothetical protein
VSGSGDCLEEILTMLRRSLLLFAATLAVSVNAAPKAKVALLPATVFKGAPGNGPVISDALQKSLSDSGLNVTTGASVERAVRSRQRDSKTPLTAGDLVALKKALGVDYVVYPRVLSVGIGVNADRPQATVLVNVGGTSVSNFVHTRQVGQPFGEAGIGSEAAAKAVIDSDSADKLAKDLLSGFYKRLGVGK